MDFDLLRELKELALGADEESRFNGPLDLLLFLVKKNEVDVFDLPVSLITSQYLDYLGLMESLNLHIAGDFLVMAAALIQIKSRMLIPGGGGEGGEGEEDPRMAIVRPLAEYALIREMAGALDERWVLGRDVFPRGDSDDFRDSELAPEGEPTLKISLFELSETWRSLCSRPIPDDRGLSFRLETATIGERLADIRRFLLAVRAAHFSELKTERGTALETSLSLLAVLELAKTGFLQVWQRTEDDMTGPRIFLGDPDAVADPDPDYK